MARLGEYYAAALIEIARESGEGIVRPRDELKDVLQSYWRLSVSDEHLTDAIRIIHSCDIAYLEEDEFAGTYIVVTTPRYEQFLEQVNRDRQEYDRIVGSESDQNFGLSLAERADLPHLERYNAHPVLRKYTAFGRDWLSRALDEIRRQTESGEIVIPASDRIVRIDDNDPAIIEIKHAADDLREKLLKGNDLGSMNREQAEAAAREVEQIGTVLSAGFVRPLEIAGRVRRTAEWIGDKAAGTAVAQAVIAFLKLVMHFLGLPS